MSLWVFVVSNMSSKFKRACIKVANIVLAIGFVALSVAIVARGIEAERFPLANLYESLLWFAWAIMGGFLFVSRAYGVYQLGWLACLTAAVFFFYGNCLPQSQHDIAPLVPALVSYWRWVHVPPLIVSYAMFFWRDLVVLSISGNQDDSRVCGSVSLPLLLQARRLVWVLLATNMMCTYCKHSLWAPV